MTIYSKDRFSSKESKWSLLNPFWVNGKKNVEKCEKTDNFFQKGFLKVFYQQPMTWDKIRKVVKFAVYFMEKRQMYYVL